MINEAGKILAELICAGQVSKPRVRLGQGEDLEKPCQYGRPVSFCSSSSLRKEVIFISEKH
jgi:hypothetical protein